VRLLVEGRRMIGWSECSWEYGCVGGNGRRAWRWFD
jgi:hypothetical protein